MARTCFHVSGFRRFLFDQLSKHAFSKDQLTCVTGYRNGNVYCSMLVLAGPVLAAEFDGGRANGRDLFRYQTNRSGVLRYH